MAADVSYFSYSSSVAQPGLYQRVTGCDEGAALLGHATGALLGQLLVSVGGGYRGCPTPLGLHAAP